MKIKYFLVYRITNQLNGKFYIGCHETYNTKDGYMGSGKLIRAAILKYGIENFKKEVLFVYNNRQDMFAQEKLLISELRPSYNIHEGGNGGWSYVNTNNLAMNAEHAKLGGLKSGVNAINNPEKLEKRKVLGSNNFKRMHQNGLAKYDNFLGKNHTEKAKQKISLANKGKDPWNKGREMSEETKEKIRVKLTKRPKKVCLLCCKVLKHSNTTGYCKLHIPSPLEKYKEEIILKYKSSNLRALAKEYGTSHESIRRLLKRYSHSAHR